MLAAGKYCMHSSLFHHTFGKNNGRKSWPTSAKGRNLSEKSNGKDPIFPLRVSNALIARSVVAVLGLGFIDAGYSGDWSRIGAISRDTEELLKVATYVVSPLCLFLIFAISGEENNSNSN
ncbi:hypothetical protein AAC387_Pa09g1937 [Persea americana]